MSLPYQMNLTVEIKAPGVLGVAAIDHVGQRRYIAPWRCRERNPAHGFQVYGGHLFALAQIQDGGVAVRRGYPVGNAATGAATVESKYETGLLRRPAMDMGIYA